MAETQAQEFRQARKREVRKSKLYNNIRILSPSGEHVGFSSMSKINWYLQRGLADLIVDSENATSQIQLRFEPKGRKEFETEFYLSPKNDECVVCGSSIHLLQHSIIPYEFRNYLPEFMKSRLTHDCILSCIQCHHKLLKIEEEYVEMLSRRYNCRFEKKMIYDLDVHIVKSACEALMNKKKYCIPELKKQKLEETIEQYFHVDVVTPEIISQGAQLNAHKLNKNWMPRGKLITDALFQEFIKNGSMMSFENWASIDNSIQTEDQIYLSTCNMNLKENQQLAAFGPFIRSWRRRFLEIIKPTHLPKGWSVFHRVFNICL
jgi:hypothetical protein